VVIGSFFISISDNSLPRPTGKEKNRCRAGYFRALTLQIPAAVLRNQGRRFPLPGAGSAAHGGSRHADMSCFSKA